MTDDLLKGYITSAVNLKLKGIPEDSEINHTFSKKFEKKMNKHTRRQKHSAIYIGFIKYAKSAAVIILVFFTVTFAGIMSVSAYREMSFKFIIKDYVIYSEVYIEQDTTEPQGKFVATYPDYIPEGYKFSRDGNWEESIRRYYQNQQGQEYDYHQERVANQKFLWNTEGVETEKTMIGKTEITYWANLGMIYLIWTGDDCFFEICGNIPKEEAFKIAESVINKK